MKHFSMIVACVLFVLFFVACEGNNNSGKDADTPIVTDDTLLTDEDGITPTDEEPEGETDVDNKTDPDVPKDDAAPVDDGTVEPDDTVVVTDDDEMSDQSDGSDGSDLTVTDEDDVVTDNIVTDDVVTDDIVTDDVVTDDITADGDELLNDDDVIVYVSPCAPTNTCVDLNRSVCTDVNLDGIAECACDDGYTLDGGSTCINQKAVSCDTDNANPANSSDIVENVTIHYTDGGGWEDPELCGWECDGGYALEGDACINQKEVSCDTDNDNPLNSDDIVIDVTVTYDGTNWSAPADCAWECMEDYHWNEIEEACLETLTIDWCNLETPVDASFYRGETVAVYGRVYVPGVTDQTADVDVAAQLVVQIGSGAAGTSATGWGDQWGPMEPNPANHLIPGIDGNDEYQYIGPVIETIGDWDMSVRVSGDSGATWTYCNANREPTYNGTDQTEPYDYLKNGHFTVNSPCDEGFCTAPHKSVCADGDTEPYYICSCDTNYSDDGDGNCVADTRTVACTNSAPVNSHWVNTGPYSGEPNGEVTQTWNGTDWTPADNTCPWACDTGYHDEDGDCISDAPRIENCVDNKPTNSHWIASGDYNGNGTVDQMWTLADGWQPPADECPWDCDATYHYENSSEQCVSNTIGRLCTNTKPTDSLWMAEAPYDGNGNLIQTWVGPGDDDWTPATDSCPWECPADTHYETSSNACVTNTIGRLCTNPLPAGADWVEIAPYDGSGNLIQTWVGPGDGDWVPATDSCPWACTDPLYHENHEVNECLLTLTVGWCGVLLPATYTTAWGGQTDVSAQLWIDSVTNISTITTATHAIDPDMPQVKAELGAGPRDTDPATWVDVWMEAVPNADIGNNDEYIASPIMDMYPGEYDYAFRFSGDSGATWTYCDTDGGAYTVDKAGKLTVTCITDGHCSSNLATPYCGPANQCVECADNGDCPTWAECNASFECKPQVGRCGNKDDDCTDPAKPVCDSVNNNCVECMEDDDCIAAGKVCDEPTYTCKLPGKLVINEVDYDMAGAGDSTEYVEIFNSGEMPYPLAGVTLQFMNGTGMVQYALFDLSVNTQGATSLAAGAYYIVAANTIASLVASSCPTCITKTVAPATDLIQNGAPDGIRILQDSVPVDALHYEGVMIGYGEGTSAPTDNPDAGVMSIGRCPDGQDTDDNGADFFFVASTPGAANSCL